jgi:hypothetical protein
LTPLVYELRRAAEGLEKLHSQARREAQVRYLPLSAALQTDGNGDGAVKLYEVPGGATAWITWLAVDEGGAVTLAAPDTRATLWHGIFAGQPGTPSAAQVVAQGSLLDGQPSSVAADAQIPAVYTYGSERAGPCLIGPGSFYFVVDAANANVRLAIRCGVYVETPEP